MTLPGVLLTGGASTRMGHDKARLVIDGEMLAVRAARVLAAVCAPVIEVGTGVTELRTVREAPPDGGPLAALLAGIDDLEVDGPVIVLACDFPFVDEHTLRALAEHPGSGSVVPLVGGREQYACARWSARALTMARAAFAAGDASLRALLRANDATNIEVDSRTLADVDTPDDLERLGLS